MAYQTGVTSSVTDLVSTLKTFALLNGFTDGPSGVYTGSDFAANATYDITSIVADGVYFLFAIPRTGVQYLWMQTASAYTGGTGLNWSGHHSGWCRVDNLASAHVGYHFFADSLSINVAVEIVTSVFVHLNFGRIKKNGSWAGGHFVTGLCVNGTQGSPPTWGDLFSANDSPPFTTRIIGSSSGSTANLNGHIRVPVLGPTAEFGRVVSGKNAAFSTAWASNCGRALLDRSPNTANGRSVLVPFNIILGSTGLAAPYYQLGYVANACAINIATLNPKDMVNTDWMVFPVSQKNGPASLFLNSLNYGLAYRK